MKTPISLVPGCEKNSCHSIFLRVVLLTAVAIAAMLQTPHAAAESPNSASVATGRELLGTWKNTSSMTRWYAKISIFEENGKAVMDLWGTLTLDGKVSEKPVARAILPISLEEISKNSGQPILVEQDFGFSEETLTLTLKEGILTVSGKTKYKDNSKRSDFSIKEDFVRQ